MLKILQDFINQSSLNSLDGLFVQSSLDCFHTYKLYLKIDDEIKNNLNIDNNIANIFIDIGLKSNFDKYEIIENIIKKFADANFNIDIVELLNLDDNPKKLLENVNRGLLIDIVCKYYNDKSFLEQCKKFHRSNKNKINILSRYSNYLYYMFPTLKDKLIYKLNNEISLNNAFEFLIKSIVHNYIINNYHFNYKYINILLLFKKTQNDKHSIIINNRIFDILINNNGNPENMCVFIGALIDIFNEHFIIDNNVKYDWTNIVARNIKNVNNVKNIKNINNVNNINNINTTIFEYVKYYSDYLRNKYPNINDEKYHYMKYPIRHTDDRYDYKHTRHNYRSNDLLITDYPNIDWGNIFETQYEDDNLILKNKIIYTGLFEILSHFNRDRLLHDKFKLLYSQFDTDNNTLYTMIYEMLERGFDAQKGLQCFMVFFSAMFDMDVNIDLFNDIVNLFIRYETKISISTETFSTYLPNINSIINDVKIFFSSEYDFSKFDYIYSFTCTYNNMFNHNYLFSSPINNRASLLFFDNLAKIIDLLYPLINLIETTIINNLKTLMNSNLVGLSNIIMDYVNIIEIDWKNVPSFEKFCQEIELNPNETYSYTINVNLHKKEYRDKLKLVLIKDKSQYLQKLFPYI
jgi:hypothetical protein